MIRKLLRADAIPLQLCVLAFAGTGILLLRSIFNSATRWGVLLLLSLFLISRFRRIRKIFLKPFGMAFIAYCCWGVATTLWSEIPALSLVKSLVYTWSTATFMAGGYWWTIRRKSEECMDFLWPLVIATFVAGLAGGDMPEGEYYFTVYAGATANSNYLGILLATTGLFIFLRLLHASTARAVVLYVVLQGIVIWLLYRTMSRASFGYFLICALLFLTMRTRKKLTSWAMLVGITLLVVGATNYSALEGAVVRLVFKSEIEFLDLDERGVFFSREKVWQESFDHAVRGGWLGGGFGVTIGEPMPAAIGFSVADIGYGREHGNAQMAIVEETGIIGLTLYAIMLSLLASILLRPAVVEHEYLRRQRLIVAGGIIGLTWVSVFEAWWVSPGSPETALFWIFVGVALGINQKEIGLRRITSAAYEAKRVSDAIAIPQKT